MSPVSPGIPRRPDPSTSDPSKPLPPKAKAAAAREEQRKQRELAKAARAAGMVPDSVRRTPLEPGRARGILAGLLLFGLGFALLAAFSATGTGGTAFSLLWILLGFTGAGLVAFFLNRGTAPLPQAPIWSPTGLRAVARGLGLPDGMVMVAVYGLVTVGVVGNIIVPLTRG